MSTEKINENLIDESKTEKSHNEELNKLRLGDQKLGDLFNINLFEDFNLLDNIKFNINRAGIGNFETTVDFDDEEAIIKTQLANEVIKEKHMDKEKFLQKLSKLNLQDWRRYYHSSDLNNNLWNLTLLFKDNDVVKTGGNNNYPENFSKLKKLLKLPKFSFPKIFF